MRGRGRRALLLVLAGSLFSGYLALAVHTCEEQAHGQPCELAQLVLAPALRAEAPAPPPAPVPAEIAPPREPREAVVAPRLPAFRSRAPPAPFRTDPTC